MGEEVQPPAGCLRPKRFTTASMLVLSDSGTAWVLMNGSNTGEADLVLVDRGDQVAHEGVIERDSTTYDRREFICTRTVTC